MITNDELLCFAGHIPHLSGFLPLPVCRLPADTRLPRYVYGNTIPKLSWCCPCWFGGRMGQLYFTLSRQGRHNKYGNPADLMDSMSPVKIIMKKSKISLSHPIIGIFRHFPKRVFYCPICQDVKINQHTRPIVFGVLDRHSRGTGYFCFVVACVLQIGPHRYTHCVYWYFLDLGKLHIALKMYDDELNNIREHFIYIREFSKITMHNKQSSFYTILKLKEELSDVDKRDHNHSDKDNFLEYLYEEKWFLFEAHIP